MGDQFGTDDDRLGSESITLDPYTYFLQFSEQA